MGIPFSGFGNEKGNWVIDVEVKLEMDDMQVAGVVEFAALQLLGPLSGQFPAIDPRFDVMIKSYVMCTVSRGVNERETTST